ncbi:autotransporter assembly complex protein TamA [Aliiroseovarius crassostreae]|uniref:autotransporter assembly complex protein TamA n=1 Tax=Aliiroseovarius crassostreae TaxID=154981 RepID=UPI003C7AC170
MSAIFAGPLLGLCLALAPATPAFALEEVSVFVAGDDGTLQEALEAASLSMSVLERDNAGDATVREVLAAALADYGRMTEALYAQGHYGGVVKIKVDGREAVAIPPFSPPSRIDRISISVSPGPVFRFSRADVTPMAPQGALPDGFKRGEVAQSTLVQQALDGAADGWRDAGYAKVALTAQRLTANHADRTLAVSLALNPGPKVRFGKLIQTSESGVRAARIQRIAGLPEGEVFSPETLRKVATRLRRTGAFASVALSEGETLRDGNVMDIGLALVDETPRRFGAGAELSSIEGVTLTGFWLHRNFLGGAERFRVDGEVAGIGSPSGEDFRLSARLDQPATFGPDTGGFLLAKLSYEDEPGFISRKAELGGGVTRIFSDSLEGEIGVGLSYSETTDFQGERRFFLMTLPGALTWDRRDDELNPASGFYLRAEATPFVSLDTGGAGASAYLDGRAYRAFGDRFVLAGRAQVGTVLAANGSDIPPDFLFYSGGGNSVRGQPYKSLGIAQGADLTGGQAYLAVSAELRAEITDTIGVVGFFDMGHIGETGFFDREDTWHSGAGLGLRYQTPIGPLRLDVGLPVTGDTGDGVQVYLGIGQAF